MVLPDYCLVLQNLGRLATASLLPKWAFLRLSLVVEAAMGLFSADAGGS
jgi:hypothetical protein